jgi:hypothetical protein
MMGKLVSLNFCFNFFNTFIGDYESNTSYFKTIASTNLITPDYIMGFINKIVEEKYFNIVTSIDSINNYYLNELKIINVKKEEHGKFGKFVKITIQLQTDNLKQIASPTKINLLKFYLVIDYGFVEQSKTYERCVSESKVSLIKYDKSILEGDEPSNFKMTFSILDENSNTIKNKIELNLNYYNCNFESTLYKNIHSRYEFVMYINNKPFYLNPYDLTNKLDKLDKFIV